jgi:hypothetical protein
MIEIKLFCPSRWFVRCKFASECFKEMTLHTSSGPELRFDQHFR